MSVSEQIEHADVQLAEPKLAVARQRASGGLVAALWLLAALAVVDQLRLLLSLTRTVANADSALVWDEARDWSHAAPHQLNYYGQSYGLSLDGIPVQLLRWLGVAYSTGTPAMFAGFSLACWFVLALAAWRRSHIGMAAAALAAPTILGAYYSFHVGTNISGWPTARLVGIVGVALLLLRPTRSAVIVAAWSLLGIAVVFDPGSAIVAVPAALWYLLLPNFDPRALRFAAFGAIAPLLLAGWSRWFYVRHADYDLNGGTGYVPSLATLGRSLGHLDRFFSLYAPELFRSWVIPIGVFIAASVALALTRRTALVVVAVSTVLLVVWAFAVPRSQDDLGISIPSGRILLMLPYAIWLLAYMAADTRPVADRTPRLTSAIVLGLVILAVTSFAVRNVAFHSRVVSISDKSRADVLFPYRRITDLHDLCNRTLHAADNAHAGLAVFVGSREENYACAAEFPSRVRTLGVFERRTWRLYDELHRTRSAMIIVGAPPDFCRLAAPRSASCKVVDPNDVAVSFVAQSPLRALSSLEIFERPFGPHCDLKDWLLGPVCAHPADTSPQPTGETPADPAAARRDIGAAFARMYALAEDRGSFPTVEDSEPLVELFDRVLACQPAFASARVRVDDVRFISARQAIVHFTIRYPNHPPSQYMGSAVEVGGNWLAGRDAARRPFEILFACSKPAG